MSNDPREDKLPNWAKQLIAELRQRVENGNAPLQRRIAVLEPKNDELKARYDALRELLDCAAKGGHVTAQEIVEILGSYSLTLTKDE